MKALKTILHFAVLAFLTTSLVMAQAPVKNGRAETKGKRFVDTDRNGINDNAPDHDGDGIPNGLDTDWHNSVGAKKGTRTQAGMTEKGNEEYMSNGRRGQGNKGRGQGLHRTEGRDRGAARIAGQGKGAGNGKGLGKGQRSTNGQANAIDCNGTGRQGRMANKDGRGPGHATGIKAGDGSGPSAAVKSGRM